MTRDGLYPGIISWYSCESWKVFPQVGEPKMLMRSLLPPPPSQAVRSLPLMLLRRTMHSQFQEWQREIAREDRERDWRSIRVWRAVPCPLRIQCRCDLLERAPKLQIRG